MVAGFDHRIAARNDDLGLQRQASNLFAGLAFGDAAHDKPNVHLLRQAQLFHLAAHHARAFSVAARHNFQRLGHTTAQAVHGLYITTAHIGQKFAQHGLRGG